MVKYLTIHDIIYLTGMSKIDEQNCEKHQTQSLKALSSTKSVEDAKKDKEKLLSKIGKIFSTNALAVALLAVMIFGYSHILVKIENINIPDLEESIEKTMDDKINTLDTIINIRINALEQRMEYLTNNTNSKNGDDSLSIKPLYFSASKSFVLFETMNAASLPSNSDQLLFKITNPQLDNNEEVGTNSSTGEIITFGDLKGHCFLTSYYDEKNKLEIWIYGELNDSGNWQDYCVLNGYDESGELKYLLETEFNDGIRTTGEYKQIRYDKEDDQYIISKRVYDSDNGIDGRIKGETYIYRNCDFVGEKKSGDVIRYSDCDYNGLIVYYNGEIFDGSFNDTTGRAYSISYHEDGTVKTLYRGYFNDGEFNDNRTRVTPDDQDSNAFWISWAAKEKVYVYWNGSFKDSKQNCLMSLYLNQREILENVEIIEEKIAKYPEFKGLNWISNSI